MKYGYCRISTRQQSIERQVRNISQAYPDALILQEVFTGTKVEGRKEFEKLTKTVKSGDTIIFDSVSRMSRNAAEGVEQYKKFYEQGVELVFLKEPHINTETYKQAAERQIQTVTSGDKAADELIQAITNAVNRYMIQLAERQIQLAFDQAEKEVQDLRQRTREGIQTARLNGKQIGRHWDKEREEEEKTGEVKLTKKQEESYKIIKSHCKDFNGTLTDAECMKLTGLARNTYYKYKRAIREGQ